MDLPDLLAVDPVVGHHPCQTPDGAAGRDDAGRRMPAIGQGQRNKTRKGVGDQRHMRPVGTDRGIIKQQAGRGGIARFGAGHGQADAGEFFMPLGIKGATAGSMQYWGDTINRLAWQAAEYSSAP